MRLALAIFLLAIMTARATIYNATDGSFATVSNLVNHFAVPGDVVNMVFSTPTTNSWGATMHISGITLRGSNAWVVIETPTNTDTPAVQLDCITNNYTRLTGVHFLGGITNKAPYNNFTGFIYIGSAQTLTNAPSWRIDNNTFSGLNGKDIGIYGPKGTIDHNGFIPGIDAFFIEVCDYGYGDIAWATQNPAGSTNLVDIEDNWCLGGVGAPALIDLSFGAMARIRHNYFTNYYQEEHGTETSGRYRSVYWCECYSNTFYYCFTTNPQFTNWFNAIQKRGGSGYYYGNLMKGYNFGLGLYNYRATDNNPAYAPFGGATGTNNFDSNSAVLISGTLPDVQTNSLKLFLGNAGWTTGQYVGCTVFNANSNLMGIVSANTSDTMTFMSSITASLQVGFKQGDSYAVRTVRTIDQPGAGYGLLLTNSFAPPQTFLNQTTQTVYNFNNQVWQNASTFQNLISSNVATAYTDLHNGVDYTNSIAMPGYVQYAYPDPAISYMTNGDNTGPTQTTQQPYTIILL